METLTTMDFDDHHIMIVMITMTMMLTLQDNGDVSDNGWAAATISAIFLPGLLGGNLDYD